MKTIVLLGDGWGAKSAYIGLKDVFEVSICTGDSQLIELIDEKDELSKAKLSEMEDQVLVFAGYKSIVPESTLNSNSCINIHYSILPAYRGYHSTVWAILNDEDYLGMTIHLMSPFIDDGDIIDQFIVPNDRIQTATDYMECFNTYVKNNLGNVILRYLEGEITPRKQNKSLASWVGKRNHEDCAIPFNRSVNYLRSFFRALSPPYPAPYFMLDGAQITPHKVQFHPSKVQSHIGRILNIDNEGIWVAVEEGYIILGELEKEDKAFDSANLRIGKFIDGYGR